MRWTSLRGSPLADRMRPRSLDEFVGQWPILGEDENLCGVAVVAGVDEFGGSDMFGLESQVTRAPIAGDHDERTDAAEFAGDWLVQ